MASKTRRQDLFTFRTDNLSPHPLAQRNTKQIQNFGYPAANKSTCKPGMQPPIPVPRDVISAPIYNGRKCIDVGQIPED